MYWEVPLGLEWAHPKNLKNICNFMIYILIFDHQNSSFNRKKAIGTMGAAILAISSYRKISFS